MKPLDVYRFGVRLANVGRSEAERRAAVGRLYCGLHHEACCRYFRENPGALQLVRGAVVVAEALLAELEVYSPGEANDGCYCPVR